MWSLCSCWSLRVFSVVWFYFMVSAICPWLLLYIWTQRFVTWAVYLNLILNFERFLNANASFSCKNILDIGFCFTFKHCSKNVSPWWSSRHTLFSCGSLIFLPSSICPLEVLFYLLIVPCQSNHEMTRVYSFSSIFGAPLRLLELGWCTSLYIDITEILCWNFCFWATPNSFWWKSGRKKTKPFLFLSSLGSRFWGWSRAKSSWFLSW